MNFSMKTLILVRHAKSSWDDPSLNDFERPLNGRGKRDAPMMADRIFDKGVKLDYIVSSPAKRAKKTAEEFARRFSKKGKKLAFKSELYMAGENTFTNVIEGLDNDDDCVAIFSHNPGITDFANSLTDTRLDNIPTCGVFAISVDSKEWNKFSESKKEFLFFDYPKAQVE